MNKNQPKIADFGCEIMDAVSNGLRPILTVSGKAIQMIIFWLIFHVTDSVKVVFHHKKKIRKIRDFEIRDFFHHPKKIAKRVSTKFEGLRISFSGSRISKCRNFGIFFLWWNTTLTIQNDVSKKISFQFVSRCSNRTRNVPSFLVRFGHPNHVALQHGCDLKEQRRWEV